MAKITKEEFIKELQAIPTVATDASYKRIYQLTDYYMKCTNDYCPHKAFNTFVDEEEADKLVCWAAEQEGLAGVRYLLAPLEYVAHYYHHINNFTQLENITKKILDALVKDIIDNLGEAIIEEEDENEGVYD